METYKLLQENGYALLQEDGYFILIGSPDQWKIDIFSIPSAIPVIDSRAFKVSASVKKDSLPVIN